MTSRNAGLFASCSLAALIAASGALAQTADAPPQSRKARASSGLEEIVVTATKRRQNLNRVGLTVTALGAESLKTQRVTSVSKLAQVTPGLVFAPTPNATPVYTLRGVGFFESTVAAYPDVSLYIDQVPLPLPVMTSLTAFDLSRVEVLKGPQGTLFGNNATGGAINFIAAKPTDAPHAGFDLGYSRFNTFEEDGYVSGPVTNNLNLRLALRAANGDDWQHSYTRSDTVGQTDELAGRFLADWKPIENLHVSLNLNFWNDLDDTQAPQAIAITPQNFPGATGFGGTIPASLAIYHYPLAPHNDQAADWSPDNRPRQDNRFKQASLRVDYDITSDLTVTSLTSYDYLHYSNSTEGDGTALNDLDLLGDNAQINSINQELRIANNPKDKLRYVIGANYEHTKVNENTGLTYLQSTSEAVNGIAVSSYYSDQQMANAAVFGNLEYDVVDQVTLKAGVRETEARHTNIAATLDEPQYPVPAGNLSLTQFFNDVYGAIYKGAVPTIPVDGPIELDTRVNANGTPVNPSTYLKAGQYRGQLNEDSTSWSVGVDYRATHNILLYVNISRGYKAGAYPQVSGSVFTAFEPVKEESLLDFEGGVKARLLQGKLSINGAGFHYDYSDKQLRAKFIDPLFGELDRLVNVPRSTVDGGEVEINARPFDGLTISTSATYLDAVVTQYDGVVGSFGNAQGLREPIEQSFAGVRLPFAPKWQYVARADYSFPISDRVSGFFGVGMNGQTSSIGILAANAAQRALYNINDRTLFNLNAGVQSADGRWKFSLFGDNVFNKYYWTNTIQSYDTVVRYTGRPADWGGKLSYEF